MSVRNKIYKNNDEIIEVRRKKIIIDDNDIIEGSDNDIEDYEKAYSKPKNNKLTSWKKIKEFLLEKIRYVKNFDDFDYILSKLTNWKKIMI